MQSVARIHQHGTPDALTEEFIASWRLIRSSAVPIYDATLLPANLLALVHSLGRGYFWRAWDDQGRVRFVVLSAKRGPEASLNGDPRMEAYFFDESATLMSAGLWSRTCPDQWQLIDRLAPSDPRVRRFRYPP